MYYAKRDTECQEEGLRCARVRKYEGRGLALRYFHFFIDYECKITAAEPGAARSHYNFAGSLRSKRAPKITYLLYFMDS